VGVSVPASASWSAVTADAGPVTVRVPTTELTASVDTQDVGYGATVRVTGRLTRTAGSDTTGVTAAPVSVKVLQAGARTAAAVASGKTLADGTYSLLVPLRVSGAMTVAYAGAAGLPADTADLGQVTAGTWTTAFPSVGAARSASTVTVTGTLTRTYAGSTAVAPSVPVKVWFTPTSTGVASQVATGTTTANGALTVRTSYRGAGSYTVKVLKVPGYTDATSSASPVS
jgi:hypothetical protein